MGQVLYANNCVSTLASDVLDTDTSFFMTSTDGTFPAIAVNSSDFFYVTLINNTTDASEIIKVTRCNPYTGSIQCIRGVDGTTPLQFPAGSRVEMRIVRAFFDAFIGATAYVPFFAWRLEDANSLPSGWIPCNGATYSLDTVAGQVLAKLDVETRSNWGMVLTATTITAPNMYTDNYIPCSHTIPGTITTHDVFGASEATTVIDNYPDANNATSYDFTTELTFKTRGMTPALYVGTN